MEKKYTLNVDPRILELLGPNLYTNIYYVLAELISNAYDADAQNVYIVSSENDIRVEDDGHGMSYVEGEVNKFLNVAGVSRLNEEEAFTRSGNRRKMGRKGVGKLAALSVSESVDILTIANGEKSGFVLSRRPINDRNELQPIEDKDITFKYITNQGTAIVMRQPQYRLNKTLKSVKRNLLKIFPLVGSDFRIHISNGSEWETVDKFDENIVTELNTIITLGENYSKLSSLVSNDYPEKRANLVEERPAYQQNILLKNNNNEEKAYPLIIEGWIGTYKTTKGRKAELTDFPDNFISIYANKKMGEFNILPIVGQNKLSEVYVVGQLHVDLFELSELPDMALSNRQGYKSDDARYEAVVKYVRETLLPNILRSREIYADLKNAEKKKAAKEIQKQNEAKLRQVIDKFRVDASKKAAQSISEFGTGVSQEKIAQAVSDSINDSVPDLGIKSVVDSQKKKILISQTYDDKSLADVIYKFLIFNNVPEEDILYTNCDDEVCRVPEGCSVYDYLRDFFVESYSTQKIFVLFVTSQNTKVSWGAITEVGASWITKIDHKIFNISPFRPEHPLDDATQWHTTIRETPTAGEIWMSDLSVDIFCQKIEAVCDQLGYAKKSRDENKAYLATLVSVR